MRHPHGLVNFALQLPPSDAANPLPVWSLNRSIRLELPKHLIESSLCFCCFMYIACCRCYLCYCRRRPGITPHDVAENPVLPRPLPSPAGSAHSTRCYCVRAGLPPTLYIKLRPILVGPSHCFVKSLAARVSSPQFSHIYSSYLSLA